MNFVAKISHEEYAETIGWIGGNIPSFFLDKEKDISEYRFYMTFQNPDNPEEFLSVFIPDNYGLMLDNNIYPNCSVKIFSHPYSKESDNTAYTLSGICKANIIGYNKVGVNEFDFLTKSKMPRLIQDELFYTEKLDKDGYEFFLQIDEDYYTDDLVKENYIFGYGALYLYKQRESGNIIAGFWQYS